MVTRFLRRQNLLSAINFGRIGVTFLSKNGNDYEMYSSGIAGNVFGNTLRTARKNDVQQLCGISLSQCKIVYILK